MVLVPSLARAVDNPDAPRRVSQSEPRLRHLEDRLAQTTGGPESAMAGRVLADALDAEMQRAYRELMSTLDAPARAALVTAQRQWLRYRDAELDFAARHWTPERSGSSYTLSRALHRAALIKARVARLNAALADIAAPAR